RKIRACRSFAVNCPDAMPGLNRLVGTHVEQTLVLRWREMPRGPEGCSGAARRLLRDRIAGFDESYISESCLELDPNQWHYSGAPTERHRQKSERIKRKRNSRLTPR